MLILPSGLQNHYNLAKVYALTEGRFLANSSDTSSHIETHEQDLVDDALNLGLVLDLGLGEQEGVKPFRRFPFDLYEQDSGRMLFESEVERLMKTKPAGKLADKGCHSYLSLSVRPVQDAAAGCVGTNEVWCVATPHPGNEPWQYSCPELNCRNFFNRASKLVTHAAAEHPHLVGKNFITYTVHLHHPSSTVKFVPSYNNPYPCKTKPDGQRSIGKRQAESAKSCAQQSRRRTKSKHAIALRQPPDWNTSEQDERSHAAEELHAAQQLKTAELERQAELTAANNRADLAEANNRAKLAEAELRHAKEMQIEKGKHLESEKGHREDAVKAAAMSAHALQQVVGTNAAVMKQLATASANQSLPTLRYATPLVEEKRRNSKAMKDLTGRGS